MMTERRFTAPPLEWVRAFEAAARCGSFTGAAVEIGLTQSAISQRIAHLEERLGTTLFHRRSRSVALTVAGEAWLPHVKAAFDGLRDSSEALFGAGRGHLTISASQSVIDQWLIPRLHRLGDTVGGGITIQTLVLGAHDAPADEVIRIRYGAGDWPHQYRHRLYAEQMAPLATPGLARRDALWTTLPRIACSGARPGWNDWASRFGTPTTPIPHMRFDTFLSALGAARAGMGVILGSLPLCEADIAAGRLVRLGEDVLTHHESYWALAGSEALSRLHWEAFCTAMA